MMRKQSFSVIPLLLVSAFLLLTLCGPAAAQRPKPSPLTEVTHDASLAGKGTAAEPLGINTSGASEGQVLTVTGGGVAWRNPAGGGAGGGLRVVDANDKEVGVLHNQQVVFHVPGSATTLVAMGVSAQHLISGAVFGTSTVTVNSAFLFYESPDCTGQAYLTNPHLPFQMILPTFRLGNDVYYPTGELVTFLPVSRKLIDSSGNASNCALNDGFATLGVPVNSFDLSALGLTAPFRVVR